MERFRREGCRDIDCDTCGHWARWARRAVRVDPDHRRHVLAQHRDVVGDLELSGP